MTSLILHPLKTLVYGLHIGGGALALTSGIVAAAARKGGLAHRRAGTVFCVAMVVMALFAGVLAVIVPDQQVNLFIALFTLYLIGSGWMTARRRPGAAGVPEALFLVVGACLCAPFAVLSFQLATGLTPLFRSAVAFRGPVLIAIHGFTLVLAIAALGDARVVLARGAGGAPRIARHLWRMCVGLTLAAGSGFTNGFARLLPGPYHVPPAFFLPQLLPLILLAFWVIRIRSAAWRLRLADLAIDVAWRRSRGLL